MRVASISQALPCKNLATKLGNYSFVSLTTPQDSVTFKGNYSTKDINVDVDTAEIVANSLSTSTSGHRAVYGSKLFTPDVVELMTLGVAKYAKDTAKEQGKEPVVLIGGDTREATTKSLNLVKNTLINQGINVLYIQKPVPTPLHALKTQQDNIDVAILMTASHNPWEDGGYNLVTKEGAIAPPSVTKQVASNMVQYAKEGKITTNKNQIGTVKTIFPYESYKDTIESYNLIDWDKIRNSNISIYYDSLKGTGENVFPKLMEDYLIPFKDVDSGEKEGPNPTKENLIEVKNDILNDPNSLKIGLANDGDADRFGIIDEKGNFITPNDVLLLTAYHLAKNKSKTGSIIRSQATSSQIDIFAKNNGLNIIQTPVGFKYIGEDIIEERKKGNDILVAGEESGGLTINSHIPEKDGIIALLLMLDLVATEEKPLSEILDNVKEDLNVEFRANCISKKFNDDTDKNTVMSRINNIYNDALEGKTEFGNGYTIDVEKTKEVAEEMQHYKKGGDGIKLYLTDGSSFLVRKSGTEPKVKVYIEVARENAEEADKTLTDLSSAAEDILTV